MIDFDDSFSDMGGFDGFLLLEYFFIVVDIFNFKFYVKLVVLFLGYIDDRVGRINLDGVVGFIRVFFSVGVKCVFYFFWLVFDVVVKLLMRNFYIVF